MSNFKDSLYKLIGDRIKSRREQLNMNQLELSDKLNISRSSVSNIEVGRHQVPLFTLYEISKVLELNIKDLIPSFDEVTAHTTNDFNDFSSYLNTTNLDIDEKDKLKNYISNI